MNLKRLPNDLSHSEARVEGTEGILKDHLELAPVLAQHAPLETGDIGPVEVDGTRGDRPQAEDRTAQSGLAATALTEESDGFAGSQSEAHVLDSAHPDFRLGEETPLHWEVNP
jgi:hypothetical protein